MTISATTQGIKPGVCLSTNRPVNPFDGQVIYMTDVDQTAVWDGSQWTVLAPIAGGRNVIINGAMQIHQRGTSTASITTGGYYTADRFASTVSTMGTWTHSIENDAPTGSGFRKSVKVLCTTADASPASGDVLTFGQYIEGQNLQSFAKGTSSARQMTLSFWVKSNVTGTFIVDAYDADNTRQCSASYTISAAATWEKKTITLPADTTGAFDNDNALSMYLFFWLGAGSTFTGGSSLNTSWASVVDNRRVVGQTNLAAATNNYWQVTGVQLEAGAVATPFEFEDYGTTLDKCQRYYMRWNTVSAYGRLASGAAISTTNAEFIFPYRVQPRTVLGTLSAGGTLQGSDGVTASPVYALTRTNIICSDSHYGVNMGSASLVQYRNMYLEGSNSTTGFLASDMEL
jgi:hypothetical protein